MDDWRALALVSGEPVLALAAGVFGALLGSFLNVCVYRLPMNQSLVRPRSRCPMCGTMVAWYDNVPVLSWLLLRARCRHCREPIAWQYPLVELGTAGIWAASVWWLGASFAALSAAVLVTLLLGILLTDARFYIIPDEFSLGGLGLGLALSLVTDIGLAGAVAGAALGAGLLWLVKAAGDHALARGWIGGEAVTAALGEDEPVSAMGMGDVKMMAMVGSFLGWRGVLLTIFLGALAGTVIHLPYLFRKEKPLVAFGIYLAIGAAVALVAGERLTGWYAAVLGL